MTGCLIVFVYLIMWALASAMVTAAVGSEGAGAFIGAIVTIGIYLYTQNKVTTEVQEQINKEVDVSTKIQSMLHNIPAFTHDDTLILKHFAFISVDEKMRKVIIGCAKTTSPIDLDYRIIEIQNVLGVEVIEDGKGLFSSSENKNTLGMAAIGGLLFGGAGAVVGAIAGSNQKSKVSEVSLRVALDDIKTPYIGLNFLPAIVDRGTALHKSAVSLAEKWFGIISILMRTPNNSESKKCPFCAELIKAEAIKCKHCGSDL